MAFVKISEQSSLYDNLENKSVHELLVDLNTEDKKVALAVEKTIPAIEKLVTQIVPRMKKGGRVFYMGAGTSGRLGVLDASELPPTFGVPSTYVYGLIAGGDYALRNAVENAEDDVKKGWEELQAMCLQCTMCPLCQTRHNVVFGVGPTDAEILFVGEGPGEQEDLTGEPFVGPAGKLLDDMLRIIDLGRHNCYIANIVKCRPPHNRDPLGTEQDACIGYLRKQTKLLNPKIIVCLGRIAAMKLIREDFKISRDHGTWEQKGGIWFTAMYHPSALLRDVTKRPDTFRDLKSLQAKAAELCTHTP